MHLHDFDYVSRDVTPFISLYKPYIKVLNLVHTTQNHGDENVRRPLMNRFLTRIGNIWRGGPRVRVANTEQIAFISPVGKPMAAPGDGTKY